MSLLWIVREQNLLLLLIAQLVISLFLIYYEKNKISYISEIALTLGMFAYNQTEICVEIIFCYLLEYIVLKILLIGFVYLAKRFAFYVLVVISHKRKRFHKFFIKRKRFLRMQSRIWNKVNYGIRVKKGIPSMVGKKNAKTGVWFDKNGFPKFKSIVEVKLERKDWKKSREVHFNRASKMVYEKAQRNSIFARKFTRRELAEFKAGEVPSKYTWHHHQDRGVLQLVEYKIHSDVKHRGGFSIWGKL